MAIPVLNFIRDVMNRSLEQICENVALLRGQFEEARMKVDLIKSDLRALKRLNANPPFEGSEDLVEKDLDGIADRVQKIASDIDTYTVERQAISAEIDRYDISELQ